jgi:hypothetical protein
MGEFIIFLISVSMIQVLFWGVTFIMKYDEAKNSNYGTYKKEFSDFLTNWKWWYFTVPFYPVVILLKRLKKGSEEIVNYVKEKEEAEKKREKSRVPSRPVRNY